MHERVGLPFEMDRAGAAQRHAATELRAGHAQHIAQHPEERRVVVDIDAVRLPVDSDGEGHGVLSLFTECNRRRDPPPSLRSITVA